MTPNLLSLPAGCAFRMRCAHADSVCEAEPPSAPIADGRSLRCFHPMERAS
jgi:peptide/nickel transport system ATP-binding protein